MKGAEIRAKFKQTIALWAGILIIIAGITLLPSATKDESQTLVKEEKISDLLLNKIIKALKWQQPSFISFLRDKEIAVDGKYKRGNLHALLILSPQKQGRILWLNSEMDWIACSPEGRYIAYHGPEDRGGIWLLDLETHIAKQVAPEVLEGKVLSVFMPEFLDERHLIIEREDKELLEKGRKLDWSIPFEHLGQKEVERYFELFSLYFAGKLKPEEGQELQQLENKILKQMSKEDLEKLKENAKYLDQSSASIEIRSVDIQTGEEKLLVKGGTVFGITEDKKGIYVLDNIDRKVLGWI